MKHPNGERESENKHSIKKYERKLIDFMNE